MGGLGTRIHTAEPNVPKAMVDVHGSPFFFYQLTLMKEQGFRDFLFCVGHMSESVQEFFGDGGEYGLRIRYSSDGATPMGTGGALRKAFKLLAGDFIVIYGDGFLDTDYRELVYRYRIVKEKQGKEGLLTVYKNKNKYCKSNVRYEDGQVLSYDKWNPSSDMEHIDFGAAVLSGSVIEAIPPGKKADLADVYHQLAADGRLAGLEVRKRFYEIGTPDSLEEFKTFIGRRISKKKPAIFFDRDGTLNEMVYKDDVDQSDSPLEPEEVRLLPGVVEALLTLRSLGYLLVVITNQPAVAKGKTTVEKLYDVNRRFTDLVAQGGVEFDDVMICPHHPVGSELCMDKSLVRDCNCRKPSPGLIEEAVKKLNIDVGESYVVGDRLSDILAGKAAGAKTVYIGEFTGDAEESTDGNTPDQVFETVREFAERLKDSTGVAYGKN